ncbi:MAG: TetR/AcrR family transcriptional regulator [Paenibacillaceae bacterium]|jgi:AcrR family transcriptional regulator|nr:TetR/AcrR family transcriptional regulator [Paenibacillaceae bacterium]
MEPSTKEKLLDTALDLFSVNGYTTVSIRDIGKVVGIKESSIYYHFKNKEDILHTLLKQAEQGMQLRKDSFNQALHAVTKITCGNFIMAGIAYIEHYLLEERIYKWIRMLTIEKQRNEEAATIYHRFFFAAPLEHHTKVFSYMMETGYIKEDDPVELAAEYQSLILFVFQKYFSGASMVAPESKQAAREELEVLLKRFYTRYFDREEMVE